MKRNIVLLSCLLGLSILDWSCVDRNPCGGPISTPVLESLSHQYSNLNGQTDTGAYFHHQIALVGEVKFVSETTSSTGFSALACSPAIPNIEIQEFRVLCDRPYSVQADSNLSLLFLADEFAKLDLSFQLAEGRSETMYPLFPPSQADTFQFTFQIIDNKGIIRETVMDPVFISVQ